MSKDMDGEIKRWTARRKSALVLDIIQGKPTSLSVELKRLSTESAEFRGQ